MKKLNLIFIFLLLISLNYTGKLIVGFVSGRSLYNLSINLITGLTFSALVLVLLRIKSFNKPHILYSLFLSQGIIFYFLFTQPRLFDKILLATFYFSGIFLVYSGRNKKYFNIILTIVLFPIIFELAGLILFDKNFILLSILRNFLVITAGYTTGLFILKS
ncbi:MAG: hypothetical protein ABFR36_00175 [Acidobacteriota bacterium]